jgi:FKBP-type peptidyl-prolyl cis-trans isomerases 1
MGAIILASCSAGMTSNEKQPASITKADVDSLSYMIGYSFGQQIKGSDFGALSYDKILSGMKDAIKGVEVDQAQFYAVLNGFMEKRMASVKEANEAEAEKFFEENGKKDGVVTTASGLQYQIVREGNGVKPLATSTIEVNYEGTTLEGEVFDSSYERGETATFPLNQVIPGWTEGLQLIDEGGEIILWIPADLAYGDRGAGGKIGPNKALKFRVELVKIQTMGEAAE